MYWTRPPPVTDLIHSVSSTCKRGPFGQFSFSSVRIVYRKKNGDRIFLNIFVVLGSCAFSSVIPAGLLVGIPWGGCSYDRTDRDLQTSKVVLCFDTGAVVHSSVEN